MSDQRKDIHRPDRVAMRPAYEWTCDACGRDNFCRTIEVEASEDELREHMGLDDWQSLPDGFGGSWYGYPETVTCDYCESSFETENPDAEFDD